MADQTWEFLTDADGELNAEIMRGLLVAQGIPVTLSQEGAGKVYGLTIGEFGRVEILVPSGYLTQARQVLEDYENGVFEVDDEDGGEISGEMTPDSE
jgi:hypothetical protein